MLNSLLRTTAFLTLSSLLTFTTLACTQDNSENAASIPSQTANAIPSPASPPPPQPVASPPATPDPYVEAIDLASSAINLSKVVVVHEDWSSVAAQWQRAVKYLQAVPQSHPKYATAQEKLPQYKRFLAEAQLKAKPPEQAKTNTTEDVNPEFFIVPILRRVNGIPIVEVSFNGQQDFKMLFDTGASATLLSGEIAATLNLKPVGSTRAGIADGSVVELPVVVVESISVNGRVKKKVSAAVAPRMPIGLLGQDFFEGYDFTVKENAIEFRLR